MIGTKLRLNAQVIIKNLENMHAKSLPPTGERGRMPVEQEYQDWARLQGRGPHTGGPKDRLVGFRKIQFKFQAPALSENHAAYINQKPGKRSGHWHYSYLGGLLPFGPSVPRRRRPCSPPP
jgi:hypothetical protein